MDYIYHAASTKHLDLQNKLHYIHRYILYMMHLLYVQ